MSILNNREALAQVEKDIEEQTAIEKKLSRAKRDESLSVGKKKGQKVSWKPANRLPKIAAPDGFVPSWRLNTPENIRRLQGEGWIVANRLEHKMDLEMGDYYQKLNDKPVNAAESSIKHNELICMILPEELAIARREYHEEETRKQTRSKLIPENDLQNSRLARASKMTTTLTIN